MSADDPWSEFTTSLGEARAVLDRTDVTLDEIDRAEGLRFLARLARLVLRGIEAPPDPRFPELRAFGPPDVTFGIPNPDNLYQSASIDPHHTYRIVGRRNSIRFFGIGAQAPGVAAASGRQTHLDDARLELDADGRFEIIASARPHDGNWIELAPDSRSLMVRQTFVDRTTEVASDLAIECVDRPAGARRTPAGGATAAAQLAALGPAVARLAQTWVDFAAGFADRAGPNEFFLFDLDHHLALGGDHEVRTPLGRWELGDDEALLVELTPPECDYWNLQLANVWTEPLDAATGVSCRNLGTSTARRDGSVAFVCAPVDPGRADLNWLDTGAHRHGLMTVRWVRAAEHPLPRCRVVALDSL